MNQHKGCQQSLISCLLLYQVSQQNINNKIENHKQLKLLMIKIKYIYIKSNMLYNPLSKPNQI